MSQSSLSQIRGFLTGSTPITWVFAGDSITHGAFHTFGSRDYTELFSERVRWELGRGRDCVIKTGVSGWRISNIWQDIDWSVLRHTPNVVSLNLGMNDSTAGAEGVSDFIATYRLVLDRILDHGSAALMLHTPNAIITLNDPSRDKVSLYAQAVRDLAGEYGAVLIDHERNWLGDNPRPITYWLSDAIHPDLHGHRRMAHLIFRELEIFDPESFTCRLAVP